MDGHAIIISLNFSPGHVSHMVAMGKLMKDLNYEVDYLLDKKYYSFDDFKNIGAVIEPELKAVQKYYSIAIFQNISLTNHVFAKCFVERGTKVIYIYHEPWDSISNYVKEGLKQTFKAVAAHYYSIKMLKLSTNVIVPSKFALELYNKYDVRYNSNVQEIPLLFDDEINNDFNQDSKDKEYFSYIGHAVKGHLFNRYVQFMKFALHKGVEWKFLIATRTNISDIINDKEIAKYISSGKVCIMHNRSLTNKEINECYRKSFCIWNIYSRSTQSGVLPKAFMFGTPVVASKIGSFPEYVIEGKTGEFVNAFNYNDILKKADMIKNELLKYSKGSRDFFLNNFYYKTNLDKFREIVNDNYGDVR